jgi:hypothetical protein
MMQPSGRATNRRGHRAGDDRQPNHWYLPSVSELGALVQS